MNPLDEIQKSRKMNPPVGDTDVVPFFDNQPRDSTRTLELLTASEAARFLAISVSGIRRLQRGRHVPFFKIGGAVRFAKNDLVAYLARRKVESFG